MKQIDIEMNLDKQEAVGVYNQAGTAYSGNPENFYLGFNSYKKDITGLHNKITDKLEQLKEDKDTLPWE